MEKKFCDLSHEYHLDYCRQVSMAIPAFSMATIARITSGSAAGEA